MALYVGRQWAMLNKINRSPETAWRAATKPAELDLSDPLPAAGVRCDVGYATFSLPAGQRPEVVSSGEGMLVKGTTTALQFAFLTPFDPTLQADKLGHSNDDPEVLLKALSKYSSDPSLTFDTFLDFEIDIEKTLPQPFWKSLLMSPGAFNMYISKLLTKSALTSMGMRHVYTFETAHTRGLIRAGSDQNDTVNAHVAFVSKDGKQAVGMHLSCRDTEQGKVMDVVPVIVKSFRFTRETLPDKDELMTLISAAGIPPEPEETRETPAPSNEDEN